MRKGNQARPLAVPDPWLFPAVVNTAPARHPVLQVGRQISEGGLEGGGRRGPPKKGEVSLQPPVVPSAPPPSLGPSPVPSSALIISWALSRHCLPSTASCPSQSGMCTGAGVGGEGWAGGGALPIQGALKVWLWRCSSPSPSLQASGRGKEWGHPDPTRQSQWRQRRRRSREGSMGGQDAPGGKSPGSSCHWRRWGENTSSSLAEQVPRPRAWPHLRTPGLAWGP